MSTELGLDLTLTQAAFLARYGTLLQAKRNRSPYSDAQAGRRELANRADLIDDFVIAYMARAEFQRYGEGAPDFVASIGTQYTDTETGDVYVNRTGLDDGWAALGGDLEPGEVTLDLLVNAAGLSLLGRAGTGTGVRADIVSGGGRRVLASNDGNTAIAFRSLEVADLPAGSPSTDARWTTVREIDFAAWPETDFAALGDGDQSLDDGGGAVTVTASSTANANSGNGSGTGGIFRRDDADLGDDGASGLRLFHDPSVSTQLTTSGATSPRLTWLLTNLDPSFDPLAEYIIELLVTRIANGGTPPTNHFLSFGLYRSATQPFACAGGISHNAGDIAAGQIGGTYFQPSGTTYDFQDTPAWNVIALHWLGAAQCYTVLAGQWSSGWPTLPNMRNVCAANPSTDNSMTDGLGTLRDVRVAIASQSRSSTAGSKDYMFRRMRMRRRDR